MGFKIFSKTGRLSPLLLFAPKFFRFSVLVLQIFPKHSLSHFLSLFFFFWEKGIQTSQLTLKSLFFYFFWRLAFSNHHIPPKTIYRANPHESRAHAMSEFTLLAIFITVDSLGVGIWPARSELGPSLIRI